jgi:quinol monooxygenase YgiN
MNRGEVEAFKSCMKDFIEGIPKNEGYVKAVLRRALEDFNEKHAVEDYHDDGYDYSGG